jgi:hypothetical protein
MAAQHAAGSVCRCVKADPGLRVAAWRSIVTAFKPPSVNSCRAAAVKHTLTTLFRAAQNL